MVGPLGRDGQAVELARQTDGVVADVDHLLHLAEALGDDLAGLERDEPAEILLRRAKLLADQPHELAPARRRHAPPGLEGVVGAGDRLRRLGGGPATWVDHLAGDRRARRQPASPTASAGTPRPRRSASASSAIELWKSAAARACSSDGRACIEPTIRPVARAGQSSSARSSGPACAPPRVRRASARFSPLLLGRDEALRARLR